MATEEAPLPAPSMPPEEAAPVYTSKPSISFNPFSSSQVPKAVDTGGIDDFVVNRSPTLTSPKEIKDQLIDKVGAAGASALNWVPFATPLLLKGASKISGVPEKEVAKALEAMKDDHRGLGILGNGLGIALSGLMTGTGVAANAVAGGVGALSDIAEDHLITEDPIQIEKAIVEVGGKAGAGALLAKFLPFLKGKATVAEDLLGKIPRASKQKLTSLGNVGGTLGALKGGTAGLATGGPLGAVFGAYTGAKWGSSLTKDVLRAPRLMKKAVASFDGLMKSRLGNLFTRGTESAGNILTRSPLSAWEDIRDAMDYHDPMEQHAAIDRHYQDYPANVRAGAQARSIVAVNHMKQVLKQNSNPTAPLPFDDPWEPTDQQKAKIVNTYDAINDPLSVLRDPSPEALQAVRAVYPSLADTIQAAVLNKVAETPDMPYEVKNKVSQVLGMPLDTTQTPLFGAQLSQHFAQLAKQQSKQAGKPQADSARGQKAIEASQKAILTTAEKIQQEN